MEIEDALSSRLRIRIFKILSRIGELNASEMARRLGVNYATTSDHLKVLEDEGLLIHKMFGRIRLFRINEHSMKAKALQDLIEAWERSGKQ